MRDQVGRVETLERRLAVILERVSALEAGGPVAPPADARPTHW